MKYHIVERDAFQVVGLKNEVSCEESTEAGIPGIQELWREAQQNGTVNRLLELDNGEITGLLGMSVDNSKQKNELVYWVAAEYSGNLPPGLFSLEVPESKWVNFEVRGQVPEAIIRTWKKIFSEWFPSNSYEHAPAGTPSFEVYTNLDPASPDSYSEIWVPIK
ncbi:GyrI-like domain-containing protein [Metabacillus arenae]|uniref:GyrI-like domain-containing protein n=1 Tax=Metabacillus arenae TaxID=2771434 RepID=UPI0029648CF3|nr:GyrI-like domain-containing protein [Metabacillus arenae]